MLKKLALPIAVTVLILTGCGPEIRVPTRVCPGRSSTAEALSALRLRSRKAVPLKANGTCRLEYFLEGKTKPKKEDFPVKLWMNPPVEIYLQGNVAFNPRGVVLGSNENEFWLWIKPKEISSYWWGRWSKNNYIQKLVLSPKIVLEAIGTAALDGDADADWSLSNEGVFDVLTKRNSAGGVVKKIYIYSCDYLVRKIEYFDVFGQVEIVAELAQYKEVVEGFSAPTIIKVVKHTGSGKADSVRITLKSPKPTEFTKKQSEYLFTRPQPRGFKNVYEVVGGRWIEQPQ